MERKLLLAFVLICLSFTGNTKNRGCYPILQYHIKAKIYNSEGVERIDQSCFKSFVWWNSFDTHGYNENSNDSVWVLYMNPGDVFTFNGKSAAESHSSNEDFGLHSINVTSGSLMDYSDFTYTASGGSCYHDGSGIEATFNESVTMEVEIPYNFSNSGKLIIQVKMLPQETYAESVSQSVESFISQIAGTNQVICRFDSDTEQTLEVYNYMGELVKSSTIKDKKKISLHELPSGSYILRVALREKDLVGKFIRHE